MRKLLQEIEEISCRHPDRAAVCFRHQTVTYRELQNRSDELSGLISRYLQERNENGRDHPIAIFMEPSITQVVAILAILKTGRPYLPINPVFPAEYIQCLLSDAEPPVVITGRSLLASPDLRTLLSGAGSAKRDVIDIEEPNSNYASAFRMGCCEDVPSDLFAVLYTSGSTGTPKGTLVPVQGIQNRIQWMRRFSGITGTDIVAQKTTYCFDVSIWEFLLPLTAGALLTIADPETRQDPRRLLHFLKQQTCSIVHFVPSQFSEIVSAIETEPRLAACLKSLRLVVFSGEALHSPVLSRFQKICGGALRHDIQLANLYGPTEASVDVTCYPIPFPLQRDEKGKTGQATRIPIGKSIDNVEVVLVHDEKRICEPGTEGEIYISGVCLAKGYLNLPELTEKSFPVQTIGNREKSGALPKRYFRTGDLAQWDRDGNLVFVGRRDAQIKIRGFRVELDGIQKLLVANEKVAASAVLLENNAVGYEQIVVYYVSRPEGNQPNQPQSGAEGVAPAALPMEGATRAPMIDEAGIKDYLAKLLPQFHLPHKVIRVDKIPLNSHGKVDRGRLSSDARASPMPEVMDESGLDPRTQTVIRIWEHFLGVSPIRPEDDFFALGGDSIMAMALATECRRVGIPNIGPGAILKNGTIKRLLESTPKTLSEPTGQGTGRVLETAEPLAMEMDPFQKYMVFIDRFYPENHLFTQISCLEIEDPEDCLGEDRLRRTVVSLVRRHSALACAMSPDSTTLNFHPGLANNLEGNVPLAVSDLSYLSQSEFQGTLEQIIHLEKQVGFELKSAPLFRFRLIAGPSRKKYLLSCFHHLICDGWSQKILIADLTRSLTPEPDDTSEDSTMGGDAGGFATYLSLRHQRLSDDRRHVLRRFWEKMLAAPLSITSFPRDFTKEGQGGIGGVNRRFLCRNHVLTLTSELTDRISKKSRDLGVTLTSYLMGMFFLLRQRMSGETDLMLLTNVAMRDFLEDQAMHSTVGCMVNQLPVRVHLDPVNLRGNAVVCQVHETLLEAREHAEIPVQDLFEILRSSRSRPVENPGDTDIYQVPVNFSFHNEPSRYGSEALRLKLTPIPLPVTSSELMVGASIESGCLVINWSFPEDLYLQETIQSIAGQYQLVLEKECGVYG